MNLLLLLSAMLSALTGVGGGVRQVQPAAAIAQAAQAQVAPAIRRSAAFRPLAPRVTLQDVCAAGIGMTLHLAAAEPLFATRRRE